ncbi:hypothetical protein Tco_0802491 [Tanacetum coccineum]|uniref:Uncharacterized protein n=1 Tax=Tanacetum coccineum TaxID=301880 RepID=A0ABQ5A366_9ASTR
MSLAKLPMLKLGENSWVPIPVTTPESGPSTALKMTVPSTTEEKICKKNDVKGQKASKAYSGYTCGSLMNELEFFTIGFVMHLYNNFKIVEQKVKRTVAGNNDDKNLAFLTTSSPSSTNTINTVNHGVSTGTTKGRKNLKRFFLEENTDAQLLLKIWVSVDEDDVEDLSYRNRKVQLLCYLAVIPMLTLESSNSQLNDKGFVDSGCSRHMSGNIAHLSDFKDFDGGYVTFGGGAIVGRLHWSIPLLYKNSLGDHPIDHVIGDVQSSVQTRRMTTSYSELGFLGAIYEGKTHHDLHTCLVSYSRRTKDEFLKLFLVILLGAIGTKWVYRNKKDEKGIVVRNKARLVAQGHTQEEGAVIYGQIEEEHPELDDIIFGSTKKELCDEFERLMKDKCEVCLHSHRFEKKPWLKMTDADDDDVDEHLYRSDDWDLYVSYTHLDKISCLQFVHVQVSLITMIVDYAGATLDRKSNHWRTSDLTSQEQTATGKDFSNPYIVGSLLKLIEVLLMKALTDGNGDVKINATIDGHSLSITEGSLRRHLKLDDQDGITSLPTTEIFAQLGLWAMLLDQIVIFQNSELSLNGVPISFDVPSTYEEIPPRDLQNHIFTFPIPSPFDLTLHLQSHHYLNSIIHSQPNTQLSPTQPGTEYHLPTPHDSPLHAVHSHGSDEGSLKLQELMNLVTTLSDRIGVLEGATVDDKENLLFCLLPCLLHGSDNRMILPSRGGKLFDEEVQEKEVQEKASTDTELFIQEVTPTEVIQDQMRESGKIASDEVVLLVLKKGYLLVKKFQQLWDEEERKRAMDEAKTTKKIDWNDPSVIKTSYSLNEANFKLPKLEGI